jgi:uncharacterized protein (TIGR02118 family)
MIHLISFLRAKPGLSLGEFRTHWSDTHGPLLASLPGPSSHLTHYAQYPRLNEDYDRPGSPDFDGVAWQSFASRDELAAFLAEPDTAAKLGPDSAAFRDGAASTWIVVGEPDVFIGRRP